jgi:uncharacterized phiE125 gp8 family phage protein
MLPQRYGLIQTQAPTQTPLTIDDLKRLLRIDGLNQEDDNLTDYLNTAIDYVQTLCGYQFCTATFDYSMDRFPHGYTMELPVWPIQSVTSVQYYDLANTLQTLDPTWYCVDLNARPARIILLARKFYWPFVSYDIKPTVHVTFVAGHTDPTLCPPIGKQLIRWFAGDLFIYRSDTVNARINRLPNGIGTLLTTLRGGMYY